MLGKFSITQKDITKNIEKYLTIKYYGGKMQLSIRKGQIRNDKNNKR